MMELSNNTILITGGTSGIGLELAKQLLQLGNTVIVTGRDAGKLEQTKSQFPRIHTFQSDVCDPEAITRLYEQVTKQFPKLNILINNAGIMLRLNLHSPALDVHNITQEIETNLSGPVRMIQQFLPHLKQQPAAAIMNVTSGLSLIPFPLSPVYSATKAGLRSYTQSLRVQLKNTNIKVFDLVAPGANTPLNDKFLNDVDKKMFMEATDLVAVAIKGLRKDKLEILPGLARVLKVMSRIAPKVLLKQLSKPVEKMLAQPNNHLNTPA
jgi:uncharacterized oxidoreductase